MSARERAVIYVDSTPSNLSSDLDARASPSLASDLQCPKKVTSGVNNYVIKIQIGDEGLFNRQVHIDVASSTHHHRQRQVSHHILSDGDGDALSFLGSSGQSSPRSDITPPPNRFNPIQSGRRHGPSTCRFGSETSESDTESDISAEYTTCHQDSRQVKPSAAQFARREIIGVENADVRETYSYTYTNSDVSPTNFCSNFKAISSSNQNLNSSLVQTYPQDEQTSAKLPPIFPLPCDDDIECSDLRSGKPILYNIPECDLVSSSYKIEQDSFHCHEFKDDLSISNTFSQFSLESTTCDSFSNFAGYQNIFLRVQESQGPSQIMSDKGTIRGVKNRVRDGIATFLQSPDCKNYIEKEKGRVVVYLTSMGVVRDTYQRCQTVKQILRNLLVKFDERDCYMNQAAQDEIRERFPYEMRQIEYQRQKARGSTSRGLPKGIGKNGTEETFYDVVTLPQVFLEGRYLGDAEIIEKLNESGELRKMLLPYKSMSVLTTCETCGGYRMLPCPVCNGSKKSVHRNHFTEELVALKCGHCDQSGLIKCPTCND